MVPSAGVAAWAAPVPRMPAVRVARLPAATAAMTRVKVGIRMPIMKPAGGGPSWILEGAVRLPVLPNADGARLPGGLDAERPWLATGCGHDDGATGGGRAIVVRR